MARTIVTQEAVNAAAQAMVEAGQEPSILAIQSAIGGGSFTTVKRCLDVWKTEQANAAATTEPAPEAVAAKAQEFSNAVWAIAKAQAQQEVDTVRADAAKQAEILKDELAQTSAEIERLEHLETQQTTNLERLGAQLHEMGMAQAKSQAQADDMGRLIAKLEAELEMARAQAESSRQVAAEQASKAAQMEGEAKALRAHVAELMATVKSWSARS